MQIIQSGNIEWLVAEKENIEVGLFPREWDGKVSIIHARIKPQQTMTEHHHERPQEGHEIYFFYEGGHFKYKIGSQEGEYNSQKPVYVFIANKEPHSITNLGDKVLEFQALYAPKFEMDEVRYKATP